MMIVFTSSRDESGENYDICTMNSDGSNVNRLTNNPANDMNPAWSPDGRKIAFVSNRDGNDEIYIMDVDGKYQMNLTNHPSDDMWPSWSPSSDSIVFESERDWAITSLETSETEEGFCLGTDLLAFLVFFGMLSVELSKPRR